MVVKCGGNPAVDVVAVCADVARLVRDGRPVVLVHGGSGEITRLAAALGVGQRALVAPDGVTARYTDAATLDVVLLALAGAVKPRIVAQLAALGVDAAGITGLDGGTVRARRTHALRAVLDGRTTVVRDHHGGRIDGVRTGLLRALLDAGTVPVVSPPALDEGWRPVNVDADRLAAALAVALGAREMVLLTGAPGVLADPHDPASLLPDHQVPARGAPGPPATGGMTLKLVAAREALVGGVTSVRVADGRVPDPVVRALHGAGTTITIRPPQVGPVAAPAPAEERGPR